METDKYLVGVTRLKNLINKLPDDGKIMVEIRKDYNDKLRISLENIDNISLQGKVLIIRCTTIV